MPKVAREKLQRIRSRKPVIRRFDSVSRTEAIQQASVLLIEQAALPPDALYLIELFNLHAEELLEAGVPYETLKVLEQHTSFIR